MLPASLHRPWLPMSFRKGMHQPMGLIDEFHEYIFGFLYESQDENPFKSNLSWVFLEICHDISMGISYGTSEIKPTDLSGPWKTLVKSPPGHRRFRRRTKPPAFCRGSRQQQHWGQGRHSLRSNAFWGSTQKKVLKRDRIPNLGLKPSKTIVRY